MRMGDGACDQQRQPEALIERLKLGGISKNPVIPAKAGSRFTSAEPNIQRRQAVESKGTVFPPSRE